MIKLNAIRKKAHESVRKGDWPNAIKEYKRLVELDKNNPNIFNELGDLYLKVGNKHDAFNSFESAIEAYTRVSLYNNAVAVCKKILRLSPNQLEAIFTLGRLRKAQGFKTEAVSHFISYLEKLILDVSLEPLRLKEKVMAVADEMPDSPDILEKVADYLLKWEFRDEAVDRLIELRKLYQRSGNEHRRQEVTVKLRVLGHEGEDIESSVAKAHASRTGGEGGIGVPGESTAGEGLEEESGTVLTGVGHAAEPGSGAGKSAQPAASFEYRTIKFDGETSETAAGAATQTVDEAEAEGIAVPNGQKPESLAEETAEEAGTQNIPAGASETAASSEARGKEKEIHVSKIVDEFKSEIKEAIDEEDYRSHYDLGMAYLEMDLLAEAIHEFQMASKSGSYQVRSLEMIGLCFLKQEQPKLAIKQLEKGLLLIGKDDADALGLLYTLGLAYEMIDEGEKAKSFFEDVYVVDVAFRDVAEKIKKYSS